MSKHFKLNYKGVGQLLRSDEMKALVSEKAEEIAKRCGDGYETDAKTMPTRAIASVYAETIEAKVDNLRNNTILKNLKG